MGLSRESDGEVSIWKVGFTRIWDVDGEMAVWYRGASMDELGVWPVQRICYALDWEPGGEV